MKSFLVNNWFKLGVLVISSFFVWTLYHTLVIQPRIERQDAINAQVRLTSEKKEQQLKLENCIQIAEQERGGLNSQTLSWAQENKDHPYDLTGAFDSIENEFNKAREDCEDKYPL